MPIPDYQTLMLPILRLANDGQEHRFRDAVERLAIEFSITDEERAELLPSTVGWAELAKPNIVVDRWATACCA